FSSSCWARASISAAVAARPANMPKFTRTSSAGGSRPWTAKARVPGSDRITRFVPGIDERLTLSGLPAEAAQGDNQSGDAPDGHDRHVVELIPHPVAVDHHVAAQDDQMAERQDLAQPAQDFREGFLREERPRDERDRQVERVHDRRGALGTANERREGDSERSKGA